MLLFLLLLLFLLCIDGCVFVSCLHIAAAAAAALVVATNAGFDVFARVDTGNDETDVENAVFKLRCTIPSASYLSPLPGTASLSRGDTKSTTGTALCLR